MLKLRELFTPSEKAILFPDVVFNGVILEGSSSENGLKSYRHLFPSSFFPFFNFVNSSPVSQFPNLSI